ncbi:unnamed protein product [Brassica oleracea var. botrytis]|uniref:3'(2'),5'-bisphosphate nucleotidase n=3 Tax=Brassica TaxID=3705 RepID=A0A078HPP6_BRANA|nr:PREDICTED: SAL2 phosphatase-like isoform X2 [Brassica oleracea var. oleracea]CAF1921768.1 unnamed protein product [Brassica napus]CDY39832.1 BnaC02g42860D [Brassica napus]VDD27383.1 unnamed protein product [Brassica oleracea]
MSYEKELAAAKKAVALAARLSRGVQKTLMQSEVWTKSNKTPVTAADYGSQAVVSIVLERELKPVTLSLVAEEDTGDLRKKGSEVFLEGITKLVRDTLASDESYADSPITKEDVLNAIDCGKSQGGSTGCHWVLDPIDGTRGFVRGEQYAVGLALLVEGKVVVGVMACPNLHLSSAVVEKDDKSCQDNVGCLFFATTGSGAYVQPLNGNSPPQEVRVSSNENLEEAKFLESYHMPIPLHSSIAKKLGITALPVRIDSQAKYAAVSRGDAEMYLRFTLAGYREWIWDHAAGSIITTEAGGVVCDAEGTPLDFSKGKRLDHNRGIIVTTKKLKPLILKAVRESMEEENLRV